MSEESNSHEASSQLAIQMAEIMAKMAEFKAALEPFNQQRANIDADVEAAMVRVRELKAKDREIQALMFDTQRAIRKIEQEKDQVERKLQQAIHNETLIEQFKQSQEEFDRLTAGAPWREWALDHQITGAKMLANAKRAYLGDKRGLGKTLTALIYCDMVQAKKIVYFSPSDVLNTVEREIAHWAPHRTVTTLGKMPKSQRRYMINMLKKLDSFVVTINYEAWRKDLSLLEDIISLQCDTLIIDEAHNIKEEKKIGFRGVEAITFGLNECPNCGSPASMETDPVYTYRQVPTCRAFPNEELHSYSLHNKTEYWQSVKNVLPMSGTPILNKPQDMFSALSLIDRTNFNNKFQFLQDYCEQDWNTGHWHFAYGGLDRLIKKISSKFIARDRHQAGVVIPPQEIQYYDLRLTEEEYPEQWKANKQLNDFAAILVDETTVVNILAAIALITRKRQMMTWPAGIKWLEPKTKEVLFQVDCQESIKLDKILKYENDDVKAWDGLLAELTADGNMNEGERVVVFSQFKQPLIELERRCNEAKISVVRYDGDTPRDTADEVVVDFDAKYCNEDGYTKKWQVVLANYKKGGVGLNLTDATHIIILDEEWNPGKVDQAYGRIDRMGQTRETTVHVLRVQGSIDTWMARLIEEKKEMIDGFETSHNLAQELMNGIQNGEIL